MPGDELAKILLAMVEKAKNGDVAAAKLVLLYTAGKPAEAVQPDRIELEDHRLRSESLVPMSGWAPAFGLLPVSSANKMWAAVAEEMEQETLLPVMLGGIEVDRAAPEDKAKVQRKTTRMAKRILVDGFLPSPNGVIGRKLQILHQAFRGMPKQPAMQAKSARAG